MSSTSALLTPYPWDHRSETAMSMLAPASIVKFWVPTVMILSMLWVSHYRDTYAESASGLVATDADEVEEVGKTSRPRQITFLIMATSAAPLILIRSRGKSSLYTPLVICASALAALTFASVIWSFEPGVSARRLIIVALVVVAALGWGRHWSMMDLCRSVMIVSTVLCVAGILLELRAGTFLEGEGYRFSGAFHPNRNAVCCTLLTLSSLVCFRRSPNLSYLGLFVVGLILTKLTGSRGAQIALLAAMGSLFFVSLSVRPRIVLVMALVFLFAVGLIGLGFSSVSIPTWDDLGRMGRDTQNAGGATLTGRIPIWEECLSAISQEWLLGYGYGAFWTPERVQEFAYIHNWAFSNAHSIFLETAIDIGLLGLFLFVTTFSLVLHRAYAHWVARRDYGALFVISAIVAAATHGLVEAIHVSVGLAFLLGLTAVVILSFQPLEPRCD